MSSLSHHVKNVLLFTIIDRGQAYPNSHTFFSANDPCMSATIHILATLFSSVHKTSSVKTQIYK